MNYIKVFSVTLPVLLLIWLFAFKLISFEILAPSMVTIVLLILSVVVAKNIDK